MKVIDHLEDFEKPDFAVVTIGTFDGVHRGHQAILKQVVSEARAQNGKSILITFWPHPRFILKPEDDSLKLLSTFWEKVQIMKEIGLDYIVKLTFTPAFSNQSAEAFLRNILIDKIGTKKLFIGYDHRFGNNREGNLSFLQSRQSQYHFSVVEIPRQDIDDISVSSTKIRSALSTREITLANTLLGRNYCIEGRVIHGMKKGRTIGFPTANVEIQEQFKLLPADGVYVVKVILSDQRYFGMLNIGFKPTMQGTKRTIEVHLFNFDEDIYNEMILVEFIRSLRKEIKFNNLNQLKDQLTRDKEEATKWLE